MYPRQLEEWLCFVTDCSESLLQPSLATTANFHLFLSFVNSKGKAKQGLGLKEFSDFSSNWQKKIK